MTEISIKLTNGSLLTGKTHFPSSSMLSTFTPLVVLIHGGGYDANYFDANDKHTVRYLSEALGIPLIALNRPGYGSTDLWHFDKGKNSFIQQSGRWLHEFALPAVWAEFGKSLNVSSIVLFGHSVGGAISVVAASEYERGASQYVLSGLAISGMGSRPETSTFGPMLQQMESTMDSTKLNPLSVPHEAKDTITFHTEYTFDPDILKETQRLGRDSSFEELYDINLLWPNYWESYSKTIQVPVLYTMGQLDKLWHLSAETVEEFSRGFSSSAWVETRILQNAPHCIELSLHGTGFILRELGFALECTTRLAIEEKMHNARRA
ncbi:uncharacterized protein HMPREF1541_07096 [Cyphellophora europaea CBS 101466]|uniref:AB hydrolase-1 domain-containing protein n=1 Tax=Cyphellophora europaea (strain CBS 101466) TaxID=1220924 RepID=W2RP27_CYPE1|nr:uncharacterized protein HMPREF1541_07096 [Cyphellophora europaea CBS 101466]ETN37474.1 hypothetical protein HMPREF1541_07096 [Cyphellophora europaea CBS 101466]